LKICEGWKKYREDHYIDLVSKKRKQPSVASHFLIKESTVKELFALAIYISTCSFSQFETPEWRAFYLKVGFKAPNRKALAEPLLSSCYNKIKAKVQLIADAVSHIQIITDSSSNISKVRVENISFLVDGILYYWNSIGISTIKAGVAWIVKNVIKNAKEIIRGYLN
jgi:hypothetical protein